MLKYVKAFARDKLNLVLINFNILVIKNKFNKYNKRIMRSILKSLHYFIYSYELIKFLIFFTYFFK